MADGHGVDWERYFRDGQPVAAPTAQGVVCCPQCGASLVHIELLSTRPAWPDESVLSR